MIEVIGCGHDSHHKKPCNIKYPYASPDYLFLLIKRPAWVYLNDKRQEIPANICMCFPPGSAIHYGCDTPDYNDDWIHFLLSGEDAKILQELDIPLLTPMIPRNFHKLAEYVRLLTNAHLTGSTLKARTQDAFMHAFFYSLSEELKASCDTAVSQKYYGSFSTLRTGIYNNPSMHRSVADLAESMFMSISHFQHLYKQFFGRSCQQDMISARLTMAKYYLIKSEMSVQAVGELCGYDNELHFMRQFKKFEGSTPTEYRLQNRQVPI